MNYICPEALNELLFKGSTVTLNKRRLSFTFFFFQSHGAFMSVCPAGRRSVGPLSESLFPQLKPTCQVIQNHKKGWWTSRDVAEAVHYPRGACLLAVWQVAAVRLSESPAFVRSVSNGWRMVRRTSEGSSRNSRWGTPMQKMRTLNTLWRHRSDLSAAQRESREVLNLVCTVCPSADMTPLSQRLSILVSCDCTSCRGLRLDTTVRGFTQC